MGRQNRVSSTLVSLLGFEEERLMSSSFQMGFSFFGQVRASDSAESCRGSGGARIGVDCELGRFYIESSKVVDATKENGWGKARLALKGSGCFRKWGRRDVLV